MKAYGIGLVRDVRMGPAIVEYLERIDETLAPFGGRWVTHGGPRTVLEGEDPGAVIVIEFPSRDAAQEWYDSDAYQAILALRADNSDSTILIVDAVAEDHRGTDVLSPA